MPENEQAAPTAEPSTSPDAEPSAAAAQPQEEPVDWDSLDASLERAYERDPKTAADRLKKHRAIGGIAGSIAERRLAELSQQQQAEHQQRAATQAREELRKMAQEKPLEFADMFLSHEEAEQAKQRIASVERTAATKIMEQVGRAYNTLDEWADLTDDEKAKLRDAVSGAGEDEVLPRFNRVALDIVADRRANKRMTDRLPKEREAWRKQWEAERLASEEAPDLRSPSTTVRKRINWNKVSDKDFNEWWKKRFGR